MPRVKTKLDLKLHVMMVISPGQALGEGVYYPLLLLQEGSNPFLTGYFSCDSCLPQAAFLSLATDQIGSSPGMS